MWQRIILGLLLAAAAYYVVNVFNKESFTNWDSRISTPAPAPLIREPIPRGDMSVSASGPNPPNVASNPEMPVQYINPAEASDPYAVTTEDANASEQLRHPERSFSPGIEPTDNTIRQEAGLASSPSVSSQAFQVFNPENITSGGNFFGSVSAMENENPNYSAF